MQIAGAITGTPGSPTPVGASCILSIISTWMFGASNNVWINSLATFHELVDYNGKIINSPNVKGKIIATGFDNRVMPLVRYDTGDEAEYSEKIKCKCGFKGKSFKIIHGRQQDYIYLNDGTKVSLTAFIFGQHFEEFNNINELQIIQKIKGVILIKIVLNRSISNQEFINKLKNSVEGKLIVTLQIVLEITKTKRGKHMFLIQKVNK